MKVAIQLGSQNAFNTNQKWCCVIPYQYDTIIILGASSFALASSKVSQSFAAWFLNFSASSGRVIIVWCNAPVTLQGFHGASAWQWMKISNLETQEEDIDCRSLCRTLWRIHWRNLRRSFLGLVLDLQRRDKRIMDRDVLVLHSKARRAGLLIAGAKESMRDESTATEDSSTD